MKRHSFIKLSVILLVFICNPLWADIIKLSKTGICHDESSPNYSRTTNFTKFNTLQECLSAGGRLPKTNRSGDGSTNPAITISANANKLIVAKTNKNISPYDRSLFEHWIDADGDCLNTRQEVLEKLATGNLTYSANRCTILRGRWLDPYTDNIFYDAHEMDIDHLVPLKWAWDHGAHLWDIGKRRKFANDEVNLFAVKASVNREKGSDGPDKWLPPDKAFRCQYISRYTRVVKIYELQLSVAEENGFNVIRKKYCNK